MRREPHRNYREVKEKLTVAFRKLRKMGLIARQKFWCCQACGCYDMSQLAVARESPPTGYVFYHEQDETLLRNSGATMLAYGSFLDDDAADIEATVKIGRWIAGACLEAGLKVEWDGSAATRIGVGL